MKFSWRKSKGEYGYLESEKKYSIGRTIILFLIPLCIYLAGYFYHGRDSKNIITVIAMLGCLPACKSAVNMIMLIKTKGCSGAVRDKLTEISGEVKGYYDFYFTSYEKNYQVSHLLFKNNIICGYTESEKCNCQDGENHIRTMLKADGVKEITIKIFNDFTNYQDALVNLLQKESITDNDVQEEKVIGLLFNISL